MYSETIVFLFVVAWVSSGIVGAIIGSPKKASGTGFILGALFGPLGAIATFVIDNRTRCTRCLGQLDGQPDVCRHCGLELVWSEMDSSSSSMRCRPVTAEEKPRIRKDREIAANELRDREIDLMTRRQMEAARGIGGRRR